MLKDPFEYETCSKEWYRAVYDMGREILLLSILGTCILFLANLLYSINTVELLENSWISQFTTDILLPFYRSFAPCQMIPFYISKAITSEQITSPNVVLISFLRFSALALITLHCIAYIASKRKVGWMQFECFTLIVDAVSIFIFSHLENTIGIGTLVRLMFHILYILLIRFATHCGEMADIIESNEGNNKIDEAFNNNK